MEAMGVMQTYRTMHNAVCRHPAVAGTVISLFGWAPTMALITRSTFSVGRLRTLDVECQECTSQCGHHTHAGMNLLKHRLHSPRPGTRYKISRSMIDF